MIKSLIELVLNSYITSINNSMKVMKAKREEEKRHEYLRKNSIDVEYKVIKQ